MNSKILAGVFLLFLVIGVSAANQYVPVPAPTPALTGHVDVIIRCQHNLFSKEMLLVSFKNNAAISVYITPDGYWGDDLLVGDYALILLDGDKGQREYAFFTVRAGETVTVPLLGHAVSPHSKKRNVTPTVTPTIVPTTSPTPTITITPTPTATPTIIPTTVPTPTQTPICHEEKICDTPGYWGVMISCIPIWHPPTDCHTVIVCE